MYLLANYPILTVLFPINEGWTSLQRVSVVDLVPVKLLTAFYYGYITSER